ncbi:MAG: hypothetical protein ACREWJ_12860 [Rhodoferax sp.]
MTKMSFLLLALCVTAAQAANPTLKIERVYLGSGLQNAKGVENASPVGDFGVWFAPQYLPGWPTAATIWPRVVNVQCTKNICDGYAITPEMGRGEYLFFRPIQK